MPRVLFWCLQWLPSLYSLLIGLLTMLSSIHCWTEAQELTHCHGTHDTQVCVSSLGSAPRLAKIWHLPMKRLTIFSNAGYWHDVWFDSISDDFVVSDTYPQKRIYASNWIPLWAGLLEPQSQAAINASRSLAASGELLHMYCLAQALLVFNDLVASASPIYCPRILSYVLYWPFITRRTELMSSWLFMSSISGILQNPVYFEEISDIHRWLQMAEMITPNSYGCLTFFWLPNL